jgi:hypothetical protein
VQLVDRLGELGGADAFEVGAAQALRRRGLADADDLRLARLLGPGGAEGVERGLRRVGQLVAVGEQERRAQRPAHQLRGGDRRAPVLAVDERDGGGPRVARARGEDRLGHTRGVRDRVGAAHARRVLGGEAGEAEVLRGLLVVARLPHDGLARLVGRVLAAAAVVAASAAARGEREQDEQEGERSDGHVRGHASRCPSRRPRRAAVRRDGRSCSSHGCDRPISGWT